MPELAPGHSAPLNVTKEAKHRIVVGLSWDPAELSILGKVQDIAGIQNHQHNLDLSCILLDEAGEIVEFIDQSPDHATNKSGHVYHSGDNVDGFGGGDDEEISAELKDLPAQIKSLVFAASIESGQTFLDINMPEMRLADGYTDRVFLDVQINALDGSDTNLFVFCQITRDDNAWQVHNISRFLNVSTQESLPAIIQKVI